MALTDERRQTLETQARWLGLAHYLIGFIILLTAILPVLYAAYGLSIAGGYSVLGGAPPPSGMGLAFVGFGGCIALMLVVIAANAGLTGLLISTRGSRNAVFLCTGLNLFNQPFGMLLAMLTLIWLSQGDVYALFDEEAKRRQLERA